MGPGTESETNVTEPMGKIHPSSISILTVKIMIKFLVEEGVRGVVKEDDDKRKQIRTK